MVEYTEKVSWNLSEQLLYQLGYLLSKANQLYLQGDLINAFFTLKAVKMRITQSLKPEERTAFKDIEKEIKEIQSENIKTKEKKEKLAVTVEKYNELLMDNLERYGYLIKKQEDTTRLVA